jgi:hypothetical protein
MDPKGKGTVINDKEK